MRSLVVMVAALVTIPGLALAGDMRQEADLLSRSAKHAAPSSKASPATTQAPGPRDSSKQSATSLSSKP